jgi:hypothetical protein
MIYENKTEQLASRARFLGRLLKHFIWATLLMVGSLFLGMAGYVYFEHLDWLDAFLNAAMLLGGMGPVLSPVTPGGKFFAGMYALYCGVLFLLAAGIVMAPVVHRIMHHFHWDDQSDEDSSSLK